MMLGITRDFICFPHSSQVCQIRVDSLLPGPVHPTRGSLSHNVPSWIWVKLAHGGGRFARILSEVFLEQHAILVDHEGHHAGGSVFRGIGDESESTGCFAIDNVLLCAAGSVGGLALEHV